MQNLVPHIESLIFCSSNPLTIKDIQEALQEVLQENITQEDIKRALENLQLRYENDDFSIQIFEIGGGYQFLTKNLYQDTVRVLLKQKSKKRLSVAALETLSIIAYKQPITKAQIEQIRGVNSDYALQRLLEKDLIEIRGKADSIGRPMLYGTSKKFMEHFGINKLQDLPLPKDFSQTENQIGEITE